MEKKLRDLIEFAQDDKRVDAAFNRVIQGIDSGELDVSTIPLPAAPLRPGAASEAEQEHIAGLIEQMADTPLEQSQKAELRSVIRALSPDSTMTDLMSILARNPNLGALGEALANYSEEAETDARSGLR